MILDRIDDIFGELGREEGDNPKFEVSLASSNRPQPRSNLISDNIYTSTFLVFTKAMTAVDTV